jgi:hypothetical protein
MKSKLHPTQNNLREQISHKANDLLGIARHIAI